MAEVVWNGIEIPTHAANAIGRALAIARLNPLTNHGAMRIPEALLYALAHAENGTFDPARQAEYVADLGSIPDNAKSCFDSNGRELSWGLFQLNNGCGLGHGWPSIALQSADINANITVQYIANRLADDNVSLYDALSPWSTRDSATAAFNAAPDFTVNGEIVRGAPEGIPRVDEEGNPLPDSPDNGIFGIPGAIQGLGLQMVRVTFVFAGLASVAIALYLLSPKSVQKAIPTP